MPVHCLEPTRGAIPQGVEVIPALVLGSHCALIAQFVRPVVVETVEKSMLLVPDHFLDMLDKVSIFMRL